MKETIAVATMCIYLAILVAWPLNIYRLATCDFEPSYKAEVIYAIGLFTPTFIITAWMDLEEPSTNQQ